MVHFHAMSQFYGVFRASLVGVAGVADRRSLLLEDSGSHLAARKEALRRYFEYSLAEAERTGRWVVAPEPRRCGLAASQDCRSGGQ